MIAAAAAAASAAIAFSAPAGVAVLPAGGGDAPLVVPGGRDPAWSPDGTQLVFALRGNIAVSDADGSNVRAITDSKHDLQPTWSPDGKTIAFTRVTASAEATAIWSVPADGSAAATPLVRDAGGDGPDRPRYRSDGSRLLFNRLDGLWSARRDGSGQRHLAMTSSVEVVPSADGSLYGVGVSGGPAYVMDYAGSLQRSVAADAVPLTFSGDEDHLLVARGGEPVVVDPVGVEAPQPLAGPSGLADGAPDWWTPGPAPRPPGLTDHEAPAIFLVTTGARLTRVRRGAPRLRLPLTGIDLLAVDRSGIRSLRVTVSVPGRRPRTHTLRSPEDLRRALAVVRGRLTLRFQAADVLGHERTTTVKAEVVA